MAGTEQWTAFGLGSTSPARRLRGRAVNANSLEQALRETSWGPFTELGSHDSSADRWTRGSSLPGQEGVHTNGNAGALEGRDRLEAPGEGQDAEPRDRGCVPGWIVI